MQLAKGIPAEEALQSLRHGNEIFMHNVSFGDFSPARRKETAESGQQPFAAVISCSDSRVIPEAIFTAGIGDLFVIRSAGNTIDSSIIGSVEYAVEHLGCNLVVVMGHTGCGAVTAALTGMSGPKVDGILNDIREAAGPERDPMTVAELNVMRSVGILKEDLILDEGVLVIGAMYDTLTGEVTFMVPERGLEPSLENDVPDV